jgi:probable rRNA maturation factor
MNDDPSSSMAGQQGQKFAGLSLDMDLENNALGEGNWAATVTRAVEAALAGGLTGPLPAAELYVELVSNEQGRELNRDYRGKDKPTNILSFPGTEPDDLPDAFKFSAQGGPPVMLGDLIVAGDVVVAEAAAQNKSNENHFVHLLVHGVLHLLGYDHINDEEAEEMETLETEILAELGIDDPYRVIEE